MPAALGTPTTASIADGGDGVLAECLLPLDAESKEWIDSITETKENNVAIPSTAAIDVCSTADVVGTLANTISSSSDLTKVRDGDDDRLSRWIEHC